MKPGILYTGCVNKSATFFDILLQEGGRSNWYKVTIILKSIYLTSTRFLFCAIWTFGFEVMASFVETLKICLVRFTNLTVFTIGNTRKICYW